MAFVEVLPIIPFLDVMLHECIRTSAIYNITIREDPLVDLDAIAKAKNCKCGSASRPAGQYCNQYQR